MNGLNLGDQVLLLMLQRVHDGAITEFFGNYFDEGRRVSWHTVERGFSTLVEVGRLELIYPPDSGARRSEECKPGELVQEVHIGLTVVERTWLASLTEKGLAKYKELYERQQDGG